MSASLPEIVRASSIAVATWVDGAGAPHAAGTLALTRAGAPVLALTFDRMELALALAGRGERGAAGQVALAMLDGRGTSAVFRPVLVRGRAVLEADPTGGVYASELREEELRRYPPARLLADSLLLCREHWWYLPRLLVQLEEPEVEYLDPTDDGGGPIATLVTADGAAPKVSAVRPGANAPAEGPCTLRVTTGDDPAPGPALLFEQDASFPDLERWAQWARRGRVTDVDPANVTMHVDAVLGTPGLPRATRLLDRWRRQRALERACRRALDRWESDPAASS
jgi:hypothetical protein